MLAFKKIIIGILFSLLFSFFVTLTSLNFLILNDKYLFYVFEKHNLYQKIPTALSMSIRNDPKLSQEEKVGYRLIISKISPKALEKIIEGGLSSTLKFVHGNTNDIFFSFPAKELGLGEANINWALSQNPGFRSTLSIIHGIGAKIFVLWILVLLLLVGLFFLYGKVVNSYKYLGGNRLLITNGLFLFLSGLFLNLILPLTSRTFPGQLEPSQALISILFSSLIPEVGFVWSILGFIIGAFGILLFFVERELKKAYTKVDHDQESHP